MANLKITDLPSISATELADTDLTTVLDVSDTTMAASGTNKKMTLGEIAAVTERMGIWSFSWDSELSSPVAVGGVRAEQVTPIHTAMRRCVMNDAGVVQYYLSDTDSTKKADGSAATLTGADGQVMVEIPRFYTRRVKVGGVTTWSMSAVPRTGFDLHPAFLKDGVEVSHRYIGAYDACYWDATDSTYKSGLNLDDLTASLDLNADKLSSVSGVYPIVGVTRAECRSLAANRGTGWRQLDFWLWSAVQFLYLIEKQTFYSQLVLGAGNTNGSYTGSPSSNQTDSPHTVAGASNGWGNGSTNGSQPSAGAKPGTAYMSYRGIENFFGNCWTFIDGINVLDRLAYVSNTTAHFADDTATNYTALGVAMPVANASYIRNLQALDQAFLPSSVTGGSATTYMTDALWTSTGWRVVLVGGSAINASSAGAFIVYADLAASDSTRAVSARLAR